MGLWPFWWMQCSPTPGPSCGVSKRAPGKHPPYQLSRKTKEHILDTIIPPGLKIKDCQKVQSLLLQPSETLYICNRYSLSLHRGVCCTAYHTMSCHLVNQSCPILCDPQSTRFLCPWNSPGKNTGVGCQFLLQGIFPTQELNPGLPHCRQILYHLSQALVRHLQSFKQIH